MSQVGSQWMAYDGDGQLTNISGSTPGLGSSNGFFVYNAEGKRTYSHVNGRDMLYVYDSRGRLTLTDKPQDGEAVERIYLESGQALAKWTSGTTSALTYLHTDHLGTPVRGTHGMGTQDNAQGLTASVGDEVFADFTTPFGLAPTHAWWDDAASGFNPTTGQGSNCGVTGFTTHVRDCDTGLHYMQARYYEPGLGRFTSVDPVDFMTDGRTGMVNRYGYTLNDPVNMWDPDGRYSTCAGLSESGSTQNCTEVAGVTGETFGTEIEAVEAIGNGMNSLSGTDSGKVAGAAPEYGAAISESEEGFTPTVFVDDGNSESVHLNDLVVGTDNPSATVHSHGNSNLPGDNNVSSGDFASANFQARVNQVPNHYTVTPSGYVHKIVGDPSRAGKTRFNATNQLTHNITQVKPSNSVYSDPRR